MLYIRKHQKVMEATRWFSKPCTLTTFVITVRMTRMSLEMHDKWHHITLLAQKRLTIHIDCLWEPWYEIHKIVQ